jgi:4-hydroxybenzoate polyprenyltransferase/phosphoserine phosphatase
MNINKNKILVVDLDGTLLKTDSLWELFFKALSKGFIVPIFWTFLGRAAFKNRLARLIELEFDLLPWNQEVVDFSRNYYNQGGHVWLATASDEIIAKKVTEYFNFFSGFIGSNGLQNLKGQLKAEELSRRFGINNFVYVGNSNSDLKIWKIASEAVVVGAPSLIRKAQSVNSKVTPLTLSISIHSIIRLIRVHQWAKNVLLFFPLIMAHYFTLSSVVIVFFGFLAFCLFSSSGYILNDLLDINSDRRHPEKRQRPFASGTIDLPIGALIFLVLMTSGIIIGLLINSYFLFINLLYLTTTILYSLKLKTIHLVDIVVLTLLYCLRVLAGGVALNLYISQWLLSFSFFVFAALSLIKRLGEVKRFSLEGIESNSRRPYGSGDTIFFQTLTSGCICSAVLTLAIYVGDSVAFTRYRSPGLLLLFCPVLFYWLGRLLKLAGDGKMPYDPVIFTLKDKISWFCLGIGILVYILATMV